MSNSNEVLENGIIAVCDKLIKEVAQVIKQEISLGELPKKQIPYTLMEPSGSGSMSGRQCVLEESDFVSVWQRIRKTIMTTAIWKQANYAVDVFVRTLEIKPALADAKNYSYLERLCSSYFIATTHITYNKRVAHRIIGEFVDYLNGRGRYSIGLAILDNFKAEKPFKIGNDITIRPICEKDIGLLIDRFHLGSYNDPSEWISSEWWICEIKKANPGQTFMGHHKIHKIAHNELSLIFRMFKEGDLGIRLGVIKQLEPFGAVGPTGGGLEDRIRSGRQSYYLSNNEIKQFVKFWNKIQSVIQNEQHYLQLPLRRMLHSGNRQEKVDSIIDHVIGLEALLGDKNEQGEINYRFKIRGSVILAKKRTERPLYIHRLAKLYGLRSSIAHGSPISDKDLEEYLPFAEDSLRYVWKWYFNNFRDEKNNQAGISRIDSDLVIK